MQSNIIRLPNSIEQMFFQLVHPYNEPKNAWVMLGLKILHLYNT